MRVDLAEGCEYLSMGCSERIAINSTGAYQRSSHVPVADDHAERRVSWATDDGEQLSEIVWIEFPQEPVARLSQHRFATKIKKLKVQPRALKRGRHSYKILPELIMAACASIANFS